MKWEYDKIKKQYTLNKFCIKKISKKQYRLFDEDSIIKNTFIADATSLDALKKLAELFGA